MTHVKECTACGHRKGKDWEGGDLVSINEDGEEFIEIEGSFHREVRKRRGTGKREVSLYACPKCDNVMFKDSF